MIWNLKVKAMAGFSWKMAVFGLIVIAVVAASLLLFLSLPKAEDLVAVVTVDGYILTREDYYAIASQINEAINNDSIKAVVISIDSRGGRADYVEDLYLSLSSLSNSKPVVAAIRGDALSGGYYVAIAANYIYATPTSSVGSIGVIAPLPKRYTPSASQIETGEHKFTGTDVLKFSLKLRRAQENFLSAVIQERGERLNASSQELSRATIYLGISALEIGLVDGIGSTYDAVKKAAEMAGLKSYSVIWLKPSVSEYMINTSSALFGDESVIYFSDVTPQRDNETPSAPQAGYGDVVVDASHSNRFQMDDLVFLQQLLLERNLSMAYTGTGNAGTFCEMVRNASSLIVISPQKSFSHEEVKCVEEMMEKGGRLFLAFDPEVNEGEDSTVTGINSLASHFGILFYPGYIYNQNSSYGIYRNVIVSDFAEDEMVSGLKRIVLFTSTAVYSHSTLALSPPDTRSSYTETASAFPVIAANESVLAMGDFTFLTPPYVFLENNSVLAEKVADFLAGKSS